MFRMEGAMGRSGMSGFRWLLGSVVLAGAMAGAGQARADVALVGPSRDATLLENPAGALANGAGEAFFAGRINTSTGSIRRAAIAFDVAGVIPPGSTVTRVMLHLSMSSTSGGPAPVRLHRLLADWGEGAAASSGGGGAPSGPGDVTWVHRFYDDRFWTLPGGDFELLPRAETLVDQAGSYAWGPTPEMAQDVQSWLDVPGANHGWLLVGDETRSQTVKRFAAREYADAALRPVLEIEYVPPCVPDPAGPGYWRRQCDGIGGEDAGIPDATLACVDRTLAALGLPGLDACAAVLTETPRSCEARAARKIAVLVLNLCSGRLQTSCPVEAGDDGCLSTTVADLLVEAAGALASGDCRRAGGCAGSMD